MLWSVLDDMARLAAIAWEVAVPVYNLVFEYGRTRLIKCHRLLVKETM